MEDLQLQLGKREEELTQAFMRIDEEAASMFPTFVVHLFNPNVLSWEKIPNILF